MKLKFYTAFVVILIICGSCYYSKQKQGEQIVQKIEQFRIQERRLPKSLTEIGEPETEEGPIYYEQLTESRYKLWYGTTLGESVIYDSDRKTWEPRSN